MPAAAIYARISRDRDREELGVGRQEVDARQLADRRGWIVDTRHVFVDNDRSASGQVRRPQWDAMLESMRAGEVEAVAAYSSSRFYRNLRDLTDFLNVVEQRGIEVATVVSGDVRVDTADGRMIARILASIDQGEWERARERIMRKHAELEADGKWTGGWLPFGYRLDSDGRLAVDPAEAEVLRDAARRVLAGESCMSVVRRWNREGTTTKRGSLWTSSVLAGVLKREQPGILAETDTDALRAMYDSRKTGPRHEGRRLLTGLLVCRADSRLLLHRPVARVRTYQCVGDPRDPHAHLRIAAEPLEKFVVGEASLRHVPRPRELVDLESDLYAGRQRIVAEMDELADSDLPLRALERRTAKLQRDLNRIDAELRAVPADTVANSAGWGAFHRFPFTSPDDPALRAWLQTIVDHATVGPARPGNRFDPSRVTIAWRPGVERW